MALLRLRLQHVTPHDVEFSFEVVPSVPNPCSEHTMEDESTALLCEIEIVNNSDWPLTLTGFASGDGNEWKTYPPQVVDAQSRENLSLTRPACMEIRVFLFYRPFLVDFYQQLMPAKRVAM